jgi:hypothetical protein
MGGPYIPQVYRRVLRRIDFRFGECPRAMYPKTAPNKARPTGQIEKTMSENNMIRTEYTHRKAPPKTDPKMGITAKVLEWPPGEISDWELDVLDGCAEELRDRVDWLKKSKKTIPAIYFDGKTVEICGTIQNLIANISEANELLTAVKEAVEEEGGDDEWQQNDD